MKLLIKKIEQNEQKQYEKKQWKRTTIKPLKTPSRRKATKQKKADRMQKKTR